MVQEKIDIGFMREALVQAQLAVDADEVPVGAVVVLEDEVVGRGHNRTISARDPSAHAEVLAMRDAASHVDNHRLLNATLYVTLEPCVMCCGCMQHARIRRLVYGAREPRTGAVVSVNEVIADPNALHTIAVTEGVLAEESQALLQRFFKTKRE